MADRVAIYLRISLDRTGAGVGVGRQRLDCRAIATARYPTATLEEFVDNDESAYSARAKRPAYQAMLQAVRDRQINAIIAWDQDRLLRQPRQLEELIDLCVPLDVPVVTARGDLDLGSHDGQLYARISAAVAKKSSDDTSRRVKRAAQDRAEAGRYHGGRHTPYGLRRVDGGLVHDPQAVACVQEMAAAVVAGMYLQTAVRDIASKHAGAPRSREGWRFLLMGEIIRGRNTAGFPAAWPPMIDPTTAASLSVMMVPKGRRASREWPLSGFVVCGACGSRLSGRRQNLEMKWKSSHYSTYACVRPGCGKVSIVEPPLMALIEAEIEASVIVVSRRRDTSVEDEQREKALEHLAGEYAGGKISRREWEAAREVVLAAQRPHVYAVPDLTDGELTFGQKLAHAVDRIVIQPAKHKGGDFDPDRVRIRWLR